MIIVDVFVPGAAKTKGSMIVRNRATGALRESVIGSSHWRALMAQAVRDDIAMRQPPVPELRSPWPGPVAVTVEAYLTPPPRVPAWLCAAWPQAGDLDKLVRNVLDAIGSTSKNPKMNGGAIVDDNLVCRIVASKRVAGYGHGPEDLRPQGVRIVVDTSV